MNNIIGTGKAQKEMSDGFLIRIMVRGFINAKSMPSVSVCTVVVGRNIAQSSWNVAAFQRGDGITKLVTICEGNENPKIHKI